MTPTLHNGQCVYIAVYDYYNYGKYICEVSVRVKNKKLLPIQGIIQMIFSYTETYVQTSSCMHVVSDNLSA